MDKKIQFGFECSKFKIAYVKEIHKPEPEEKKTEIVEPKLIEERKVDTYV